MKKIIRFANVLCVFMLLCLFFVACSFFGGDDAQPTEYAYSVFSWDEDVMLEENRQQLIETLNQNNITSFYQHVGSDADIDDYSDFSLFLAEYDILFYGLVGDPSWGLLKNIEDLTDAVERISEIEGAAGIVIDVEPGQIDDFDDNETQIMGEFGENMNTAYLLAKDHDLDVVVCVPVSWDDQPVLSDLIQNSCDAVCVMNYFVDREFDKIQTEAELAKQFGKTLINASELQPVGLYGLTKNNTYHGQGLQTVQDMWLVLADDLYEEYKTTDLAFSYHNYEYLLKESTEE